MSLKTLKPRLQAIGARLAVLTPPRPDAVQRKRGWAGVQDRERIRRRDHGLCQECRRQNRVSLGAAVDHKKPLWDGGDDTDNNKELLCQPCHDATTAREAAQRAGR